MTPQASDWLRKPLNARQQELRRLIDGQDNSDYIQLVAAGSFGVVASLGKHFSYAIFGRDSIRVAKDLIETHSDLSRTIIMTLAHLQGTKIDYRSEEEPGKIHHEYRCLFFNGQRIPRDSEATMQWLQQKWGGDNPDEMIYYGSYDATPMYIRLVHNFFQHYGNDFLQQPFQNKDGQAKTIEDSLHSAIKWLVRKLESSEWGLLEYTRSNPKGIPNQVWKDSETAYMHTDGTIANLDQGVAAIELQGYAYDALMDASDLFPEHEDRDKWHKLAKHIQRSTIDDFWMEDVQFFAQGLDRDSLMNKRQIATLTSNPGLLLRSALLRDIDPQLQQKFVNSLVSTLSGPEFMTEGGIRCRALRHKDHPHFPDYHGSFTTWPKETYEIAKGMHAHGFIEQAKELDSKLLEAIAKSGDFYEFFYANDDGSIWHNSEEAMRLLRKAFGESVEMPTPERGQAWTISAVLAILNHRKNS